MAVVTVADNTGTISISDGNSVIYIEKKKVDVTAQGGNVTIRWDENTFVTYTAAQFISPSGTAAAIAAAIAVFLDTGAAAGITGSGTANYIPKWTAASALGNSLLYDNGTTVMMGATTAIASAQFAMTSTTQGFLMPKMTTAQKNLISTPATGLQVFDTTLGLFSYYTGSAWVQLDVGEGTDWSILGNAGTVAGTNFIGTTDDINLVFKRNNVQSGLIAHSTNNTSFGSAALLSTSTGTANSAFGAGALAASSSGGFNVAVGTSSLYLNTIGQLNTAVGVNALNQNLSGEGNTALGLSAGHTNSTGTYSVFLGYNAGYYETGSSKLFIDNAQRASESDGRIKALIYGVFDAAVANQTLRLNASVGVNIAPLTTLHVYGTYVSPLNNGLRIASTNGHAGISFDGTNGGTRNYAFINGYNSAAMFEFLTGAAEPTTTMVTYDGARNLTAFGMSADILAGLTTTTKLIVKGNQIIGNAWLTGTVNAPTDGLSVYGAVGFGFTAATIPASTQFALKGSGATSSTFTMKVQNSAALDLFQIQDHGAVSVGTTSGAAAGNVIIGSISSPSGASVTGGENTGLGFQVFQGALSSYNNVAIGTNALNAMTSGGNSVGIGSNALKLATTSASCIGIGHDALKSVVGGGYGNVAIGQGSQQATTGAYSTSVGFGSLFSQTSGNNYNTAFGYQAGYSNVSGTNCVSIGNGAGYYETGSNKLFIDSYSRASEADGRIKALIYGVFDATVTNQVITFNASAFINGRVNQQQGTDAASASTLTLAGDGNTFELTGTTSVTLITKTGWQDGSVITLVANESVTITNGTATSGSNITILLAGAANFAMTANDTLTLVLCSTTAGGQAWRELARTAI